jgi:hypothetical protein
MNRLLAALPELGLVLARSATEPASDNHLRSIAYEVSAARGAAAP